MSPTIIAALITSVTTVVSVVYTNRRQLRSQTREFKAITEKQTEHLKAHGNPAAESERT